MTEQSTPQETTTTEILDTATVRRIVREELAQAQEKFVSRTELEEVKDAIKSLADTLEKHIQADEVRAAKWDGIIAKWDSLGDTLQEFVRSTNDRVSDLENHIAEDDVTIASLKTQNAVLAQKYDVLNRDVFGIGANGHESLVQMIKRGQDELKLQIDTSWSKVEARLDSAQAARVKMLAAIECNTEFRERRQRVERVIVNCGKAAWDTPILRWGIIVLLGLGSGFAGWELLTGLLP